MCQIISLENALFAPKFSLLC